MCEAFEKVSIKSVTKSPFLECLDHSSYIFRFQAKNIYYSYIVLPKYFLIIFHLHEYNKSHFIPFPYAHN